MSSSEDSISSPRSHNFRVKLVPLSSDSGLAEERRLPAGGPATLLSTLTTTMHGQTQGGVKGDARPFSLLQPRTGGRAIGSERDDSLRDSLPSSSSFSSPVLYSTQGPNPIDHPQDWHSFSDGPVRRMMRTRILTLMRSNTPCSDLQALTRLPVVARRLEESLYNSSGSRGEYATPGSMKRRLQSIAVAKAIPDVKRRLSQPCATHGQTEPNKRARRAHESVYIGERKTEDQPPFLLEQLDVVRKIYGFLDGVDAIQSLSVCHAARRSVPRALLKFIFHAHDFEGKVELFTRGFSQLKALREIHMLHKGGACTKTCRMDYSRFIECNCHDSMINAMADGLTSGSLTELEVLDLNAGLVSQPSLDRLFAALAGSHHQIRELCLVGCGLGSAGAARLAESIRSGRLQRLKVLDLRSNFIDEAGFQAIISALCQTEVKLSVLDLSANILTDSSLELLRKEMRDGGLGRTISKFSLTNNFISDQGLQSLLKLLEDGVVTRLMEIDLLGNSCSPSLLQQLNDKLGAA